MVGDWLSAVGLPLFNWVGLTLVALAAFCLGAQAALGFSWARVAETIGRAVHVSAHRSVTFLDGFRDRRDARRVQRDTDKREAQATAKRKAKREKAVARERKRNATRKPPRIDATAVRPDEPAEVQQELFDRNAGTEMPDFELLDEHPSDQKAGYSDDSL